MILVRIILVWAAIVLLRLFHLQVVSHAEYKELAQRQQERVVEVRAQRGSIFDRSGQPLAMSLPLDSVCVNPQRVPDLNVAADILSRVLELDRLEFLTKLAAYKRAGRGFMWVKRKIRPDESKRIRSYGLEWVEFRTESHRIYPKGSLASHVVGAVNHDERGVVGLEASLDEDLEGRPGVVRLLTDVRHRGFETHVSSEGLAGISITTTLDERIQFVAERELKKAVEEHQCKTGSLLVMKPGTGEILAMANYPTFNPNEPVKRGQPLSHRLNLSVSAPFEPGSVFKVITVAAALEKTPLKPKTVIPCGNGIINLFGRVIRDHDPYDALSMADVLAKSSNIGAIQVGLRVGDATMFDYIQKFGFGRMTGVPLPAESAGMLRRLKNWSKSSIGSIAMGHELSTTTLQLAQACSVVANGGLLIRPRLILRTDPPVDYLEPAAFEEPVRILKPETAITMRSMMEGVVLKGTGTKARLDGYSAGGKTGSAQIFDFENHVYTHRYNASFMGFAPVPNPAIVVVVTLNGASKYGGAVAAPVFREVAMAALRVLDVPPDVPYDAPAEDDNPDTGDLAIAELAEQPPPEMLRAVGMTTVFGPPEPGPLQVVGPKVPNFRGKTVRNVIEQSSELGLPVEFVGTGIARLQTPPAGATLGPGERVKIFFAR
jgi:cell division protein FtsI (penicillin-binding protein 3)